MRTLLTSFIAFSSLFSSAQDAQWFELGATWVYNWNGVADPDQEDFIYTYAVTELTEYLGQSCSKIEADGGSFGCLLATAPYYMYHSNDTIYYATEEMEEFAIGYVLSMGAEWEYSVGNDIDDEEIMSVMVLGVSSINIDGQDINNYEIEYTHLSGEILAEIFPAQRTIWEFIGDPNMFIVPYGVSPFCDFEINVSLRCFTSPSMEYLNPDFSSCTLSLDEVQKERQVFFPNPAGENISWAEPIDQISIFDATGKLLLQKQINGEQSLSVEHLPSGFYTVLFNGGDANFSQKVIIE